MKHFSTLIIIVAITVLISACGTQATPTVNPADIAGTAQAAAFTMIAQTQAAIPTATLPPPTEPPTQTPVPTNTAAALPTLPTIVALASPTTAPANNAGGDPCNTRILSGGMKGQDTRIRIVNTLKVPVVVSIYLNEQAGSGACGWGYVAIPKNGDVVIDNWVQGCYELWARSADGVGAKDKFNSYGSGCINNPDKWTFEVGKATVKFVGP